MALNGVIGKAGDVDHFVFKAKKGQVFDIRVYARPLRSPLDSVLHIAKRNGGAISPATTTASGPDSYLRFTAPDDGEYVVSAPRPPQEGRARLLLPDRGHARSRRSSSLSVAERVAPARDRADRRGRPEGEPAGDPGQRHPRRLRRRPEARALEGLPAGRRRSRPTPMAASLGDVSRSSSRPSADAPLAGTLADVDGQAGRSRRSRSPASSAQTVELVLGQNNVPFWTADGRPARRRRDRGGPVLDRDRRAQGAAGPGRLDGPEGRRQAQARLQGGDRGLPALEPAGRRLVGRRRDPREGRTRP